MVVVKTGGIMHDGLGSGSGIVAVEFGLIRAEEGEGEEEAAVVEFDEGVILISRCAIDGAEEAAAVVVADADALAGAVGVAVVVTVEFNAADKGQYVGWGVAPGGTSVPFAMVSVSVDPPPTPPAPEVGVAVGVGEGEGDGGTDEGTDGCFAVRERGLAPDVGLGLEVVLPGFPPLLPLSPPDGGTEAQRSFAAAFAPPPAPPPAAACASTFREFSACGI